MMQQVTKVPASSCRQIVRGSVHHALRARITIPVQLGINRLAISGSNSKTTRLYAIGVNTAAPKATSSSQRRPQLPQPNDDALPLFLNWAVQNGIEGIGSLSSKVSMFETTSGDRGLLCTQDVRPGDELLTVPLRLAMTDHPDDAESNAMLYEDAPWSVRLSTKLLRECAKGTLSPWWPYLQVLPRHVHTPSEIYSWEDIQAIDYEPAKLAIYELNSLLADAYRRCSPEALGGASSDEFTWAMSVVHSRTFGSAAPQGGVGVRMLVPLVDMLNHGGDEVQLDGQVLNADNVRWDLKQLGADGAKAWCMIVTATSEIYQGEQVVLSYGERPNDDFLVHYGFTPPRNAHDEYVLFQDLEEALEWHYLQYNGQMPVAEAEALYKSALEAGLTEQWQERQRLREAMAAAATTAAPGLPGAPGGATAAAVVTGGAASEAAGEAVSTSGREEALPTEQEKQVKLLRGSRVSSALMVAFAMAAGGDNHHAEAALVRRCAQLQATSQPLLQDLSLLARDAAATEELQHDAQYYAELFVHYRTAIMRQHEDLLAAAGQTTKPAFTAAPSTPPTAKQPPTAGGDSAGPPAAVLAAAAAIAAEPARSPEQLMDDYSVPGVAIPLTWQQRLTTRFMADKKRLLWDLILAAGPPPGVRGTPAPPGAAAQSC